MIAAMTNLNCTLGSLNLPNGDAADARYYLRHNGIVRETTVYENVGKRCGLSAALARAVGESLFAEIIDLLHLGYRVELPQMAAYLTIQGKKAAEAKGHASIRPTAAVHLQPRGVLKDCCKGAFSVNVVTEQTSVVIDSFIDAISKQYGAITNGTDVHVEIAGLGLYMSDLSDPTVGVWLEDPSGRIHARAVVKETTSTTLDILFPKIDLPVGDGSHLCVASRGLSTGVHSVRTVRRRVTVLPAPAASE